MQRVIRTDGWTADWRLSSALWEAYSGMFGAQPGEGRLLVFQRPVAILCVGSLSDPVGASVAHVADELKLYYPIVEGGTVAPLDPAAVRERVAVYRRPDAGRLVGASLFGSSVDAKKSGRGLNDLETVRPPFVAVVSGKEARLEERCGLLVNSWVVSEEDDEEDPALNPEETGFSVIGDVDVEIAMSLKRDLDDVAVDRVIDGFLRFFFKIGHDHTRFQRGR